MIGNSYLDGQQSGNANHRGTGDRIPHRGINGLNGSSRSLASTHPMLTGFGGHYTPGHVGLSGHGGPSPGSQGMGETLRHHLGGAGAAGTSLSSKVHTVILSGRRWWPQLRRPICSSAGNPIRHGKTLSQPTRCRRCATWPFFGPWQGRQQKELLSPDLPLFHHQSSLAFLWKEPVSFRTPCMHTVGEKKNLMVEVKLYF